MKRILLMIKVAEFFILFILVGFASAAEWNEADSTYYNAGTDANNMRNTGQPYYGRSSSNPNFPINYGVIYPFQNYPGSEGDGERYVTQLLFQHPTNNIYVRNSGGDGSHWSSWTRLLAADETLDKTEITINPNALIKADSTYYNASTDANNMRNTGQPYYGRSSSNPNFPINYGVIYPFQNYPGTQGDGERYITQLLFQHPTNNIYVRNSGGDGNHWSNWTRLLTADETLDKSKITINPNALIKADSTYSSAGTDANNMRNTGQPYYGRSSSNPNFPITYGVIYPFQNYPGAQGDGERYITQLLFQHPTNNIYIRNSGGNGNSWSNWARILNDKDNLISSGSLQISGQGNHYISNGNVGIGTVEPQSKLAVNGKITAKEIVVTEAGWGDYVFEENYELPALDIVEKFIKENKHLQDVPSAKEIKEKGLSMAEMMVKQMQKIEELTLYLIEQNKKITEQVEKIAKIEKQNIEYQSRLSLLEEQLKFLSFSGNPNR